METIRNYIGHKYDSLDMQWALELTKIPENIVRQRILKKQVEEILEALEPKALEVAGLRGHGLEIEPGDMARQLGKIQTCIGQLHLIKGLLEEKKPIDRPAAAAAAAVAQLVENPLEAIASCTREFLIHFAKMIKKFGLEHTRLPHGSLRFEPSRNVLFIQGTDRGENSPDLLSIGTQDQGVIFDASKNFPFPYSISATNPSALTDTLSDYVKNLLSLPIDFTSDDAPAPKEAKRRRLHPVQEQRKNTSVTEFLHLFGHTVQSYYAIGHIHPPICLGDFYIGILPNGNIFIQRKTNFIAREGTPSKYQNKISFSTDGKNLYINGEPQQSQLVLPEEIRDLLVLAFSTFTHRLLDETLIYAGTLPRPEKPFREFVLNPRGQICPGASVHRAFFNRDPAPGDSWFEFHQSGLRIFITSNGRRENQVETVLSRLAQLQFDFFPTIEARDQINSRDSNAFSDRSITIPPSMISRFLLALGFSRTKVYELFTILSLMYPDLKTPYSQYHEDILNTVEQAVQKDLSPLPPLPEVRALDSKASQEQVAAAPAAPLVLAAAAAPAAPPAFAVAEASRHKRKAPDLPEEKTLLDAFVIIGLNSMTIDQIEKKEEQNGYVISKKDMPLEQWQAIFDMFRGIQDKGNNTYFIPAHVAKSIIEIIQ